MASHAIGIMNAETNPNPTAPRKYNGCSCVNAMMIGLVAMLLGGFHVNGLIPGVLAAIVTGVASWIGGMLLRDDRK